MFTLWCPWAWGRLVENFCIVLKIFWQPKLPHNEKSNYNWKYIFQGLDFLTMSGCLTCGAQKLSTQTGVAVGGVQIHMEAYTASTSSLDWWGKYASVVAYTFSLSSWEAEAGGISLWVSQGYISCLKGTSYRQNKQLQAEDTVSLMSSGRSCPCVGPNRSEARNTDRKQQNACHSLVLGLNVHVEMRLKTLGNNAMKWIVWGFRLLWLEREEEKIWMNMNPMFEQPLQDFKQFQRKHQSSLLVHKSSGHRTASCHDHPGSHHSSCPYFWLAVCAGRFTATLILHASLIWKLIIMMFSNIKSGLNLKNTLYW